MATQQPAGAGPEQNPPTPPLLHNTALAGAILCPLIMLLPPRRMDWRFGFLTAGFTMSASQLTYDWTGRSIHQRMGDRLSKTFSSEMPEAAKETQRRLREERMRKFGFSEEEMRRHEAEKRGKLEKLWYGDQATDDWQKKRWEEHQQALEEGKGLSGIIMDQVKEVLPGSKGKDDKKSDDEQK